MNHSSSDWIALFWQNNASENNPEVNHKIILLIVLDKCGCTNECLMHISCKESEKRISHVFRSQGCSIMAKNLTNFNPPKEETQ